MRRLQVLTSASIILAILLVGLQLNSASASPANWPMYRNNLQHTGVAADVVLAPLDMKWKQTFGGNVSSSPAIVGSRVYVGSLDNNLYALDAATGAIIWSFNDAGAAMSWESSPAVATVGGKTVIFAGNDNGKLYAIRDDGSAPFMVWSFLTGGNVVSSPAVTSILGTQVVIFGTTGEGPVGQLFALVAATGALYPGWTTNPFTDDGGAKAFDASPAILGSTLFIGNENTIEYAINLGNGVVLWAFFAEGPIVSSSAVAHVGTEDLVVFGSDDNSMRAVTAAGGTLKWSFATGNIIRSSPAVATIPNPPDACAPGPTLGVFFGSSDGNTYAVRASDGTPCWTFPSTGLKPFDSSPTVSGEIVYTGSFDHSLYAININDGTWKWSFPSTSTIGDPVVAPNPAISGSTLYFGSNAPDNSLYAFQPSPVATTVTVTSTLTTSSITSTSTETSTTTTTTTGTVPPPAPVPGFPLESILVGLAGGLVALTLLGRRRRKQ